MKMHYMDLDAKGVDILPIQNTLIIILEDAHTMKSIFLVSQRNCEIMKVIVRKTERRKNKCG